MKIAFVFNLMVALLWFSSVNAQVENQNVLPADYIKNTELACEKVYLNLDRLIYSAGEDIWIKAYLVDAVTNKSSDNSNNLNVELISPGSNVIKRP
jgi:hypothetical protein